MPDYVDPKRFQAGAETARMKAFADLEGALQLAPGTGVSRLAAKVLFRSGIISSSIITDFSG